MKFPLRLDDAAVFPPGDLPLADAVAAHRTHRKSWYADLVGPLVVPFSALSELTGLDEPLDVAVVVPDASAAVSALNDAPAAVRVVALEVTEPDVSALRAAVGASPGTEVYVEVPRDDRHDAVVADLAGTAYRGKLRTGGVRADLHPGEVELADAIMALARAEVPFKATAGLHHALRNTDPGTGFEQHGFLNLLLATAAAQHGADAADVAALLAVRDFDELPPLPRSALFGAVGTCSIAEPVDELGALGLLPEVVR